MNRRGFMAGLTGLLGLQGYGRALAEPETDVIYARAGETITCEHGHAIVSFADTVRKGQMFDIKHLVGWRQPQPKIGAMTQPCAICGADWFRGTSYHFINGWRGEN